MKTFNALVILAALTGGCASTPTGEETGTGADMAVDLALADRANSDDLATQGGVDAAVAMTGCNGLVLCYNGCVMRDPANPTACTTACRNNTTAQGQQLFQSLVNCIRTECPIAAGAVCDPAGSKTDCDRCVTDSQMAGQACAAPFSACAQDGP